MDKGNEKLILQHFDELVQTYPGLAVSEDAPGRWVVRGLLAFSATFNDITINDAFSILIILPDDYPNSPPIVQETGGRIPPDFHQYRDRTLCLGAPVEVYKRFKAAARLLPFVQTLLIEYLFGYVHLKKFGILPFGELSHGCQGIREYYQNAFNTEDVNIVMGLLKILADDAYRGHLACTCGSGKILRKCHGPHLLSMQENQQRTLFLRDAENMLYSLKKEELEGFNWKLLPKEIQRELNSIAREKAQMEKYV